LGDYKVLVDDKNLQSSQEDQMLAKDWLPSTIAASHILLLSPWNVTSGFQDKHATSIKLILNFKDLVEKKKKSKTWAGEMAQWLGALTALLKVLSSNPSNHMVAHNHP
jgi:hypothetical protein